jgi:hypothetical protein
MTAQPAPHLDADGFAGAPRPTRTDHAHLWSLPDGTGLHAPRGRLTREEGTGRLCCHLCGRWFRSLASHVRRHGYTAEAYREAMGLCRTRPLISSDVSAAISDRQARAYAQDPEVRRRLLPGQELARSGALVAAAHAATRGERRDERQAVLRESLRQGRETVAQRREQALQTRLDALGATSLGDYLRTAYAAGASLEQLGRATGLGWARLREELARAGVVVRSPGDTSPQGRRSRAEHADAAAAARVGTDDLHRWLTERRAAGATLTELAATVGHSTHWVRWRLAAAAHAG